MRGFTALLAAFCFSLSIKSSAQDGSQKLLGIRRPMPAIWRSSRATVLLLGLLFSDSIGAQTPIGETTQKPLQVRELADSKVALQNGAMTSNVAIAVPEYHGIAPQLSLAYSSSAGNGFAGVGWDLQGFSVIERAAPNRGSPRYGQVWSNDVYLLNGEELIPSTSMGGTYATRRQSFMRISGSGAPGGNWTVTQRDGTVMTFSPVFIAGGNTFRWGLTKVQDTHGNAVTYSWQCDTTALSNPVANATLDCYPASITYATTVITVFREMRTDAEAFATGYRLGKSNYRLRSIKIQIGPALLRAYKITYTTSARTARSLLSTIQQFGRDATIDGTGVVSGGTALPPITSTWSDTARGLETAVTVSDKYGLTLRIWQCSDMSTDDFNGDGRMDFLLIDRCSVADTRVYLLLANGTGTFSTAVDITNNSGMSGQIWLYSTVKATGDFDGDGTADLLVRYTSGSILKIYRLLGSFTGTFGTATDIANSYGLNTTTWTYADIQLADFNGDGRADLLLRGLNGNYFAYLLTASSSGNFNTAVNVASAYGMTGAKWNTLLTFGDFNGDGKTDLILRDSAAYSAYLLQANPAGGFNNVVDVTTKYTMTGQRWLWADVVAGDFNGDGRTDLFVAPAYQKTDPYILLYAQGSDGAAPSQSYIGFENPIVATTLWGMTYDRWQNATILGGDFNGDGRTDLLVQSPLSNTSVQDPTLLLFSIGPGFQTALDVTNLYDMTATWWAYSDYRIGDYDGDGDDDLFRHAYAGGGVYAAMPQQMLKGNGATGNLITALANGYGGTTTVSYKPSAAWPNSNNPPRSQTVSALTITDGRGWSSTTNYSYSGGAWEPVERRHLGFRYVKATNPTGAYGESYFYQGAAYQTGELEDFYQRNSTSGVMTRTYRMLTGTTAAPWVRNLTQQDDYECNGDSTCKQAQKSFVYDAYGNITSVTDHGEVDTSVTGDERTTVYSYNANAAAYVVSAPAVISTYQGTSTAGVMLRQARFYYDNGLLSAAPTRGDATGTENWLDTANRYLASTATYDVYGNKTSETDPLTHTTLTTWDAAGLLPLSTTNALSQVESSTWDSVCRAPLTATDANSKVTIWSYDNLCRRKTETLANGRFSSWDYVNFGSASTQYTGETVNDGAGGTLWRVSFFDGLGREWQSYNNVSEIIETTYDSRGQVATLSAPYVLGEAKKLTTNSYDALQRLTTITSADNSTRKVLYGDWRSTTCDQLGKPRTSYRDAYHQVRQVREYEGLGCTETPVCVLGQTCFDTRIDYDLLGRQIAITDALGNISTSTFDSLGRRTVSEDPDLGYMIYRYDDDGSLVLKTNDAMQKIAFAYDALHRPTQKVFLSNCPSGKICPTAAAPASTIDANYYYDQPGHGAGIGRRTSMSDYSGSASVTYDAMGEVTAEQKTIGVTAYATGHVYDVLGRVKSTTYPDGEVVTRTYDAAGRLKSVGAYVTAASYDARGNLKTRTLGNGLQDVLSYNASRFWLDNVKAVSGATPLYSVDLGHNIRGEVTSRSNATATLLDQWTYGYDDRRRLTQATNTLNPAWSQAFAYDELGRMTSQTGVGNYTYPTLGTSPQHAPASVGGSTHTYDFRGNLLSGSGNWLSYDLENRPTAANGVVTTYDGDGVRVKAGSVTFVSNLYESDTSSGAKTNYIYFNNTLVARKRSGVVNYYHGDQLGSVGAMSSSAGAIVLTKTYSPFGKVLKQTGTLTDAFGLAGQRLDPTGLYHMGAREMAPGLGIFVTPDPSNAPDPEQPQTLNRYSYANNSPTNLIDPTGYAAQEAESAYDSFSFWAHSGLSGAGAIPAVGIFPDAVDFLYTAGELPFGKSSWTDLSLAGVGILATAAPVAGDVPAAAAKITARQIQRALARGVTGNAESVVAKSAGQLGREGEALASQITGVGKNTKSFIVNGRVRIPDQVLSQDMVTRSPLHILEVKNVQSQSLTRQLRDNVDLVGPGGRVDVALPTSARVTRPLQRAFDNPLSPLNRVDLR